MTFVLPDPTASQNAQQTCVRLMQDANTLYINTLNRYRSQWNQFWDSGLSVAEMQAQLDYLSTLPAVDSDGKSSNALAEYFAKAERFTKYIVIEVPNAFADSLTDVTGTYHQFLTSGWVLTVDNTGRMIVSSPCEWVQPQ